MRRSLIQIIRISCCVCLLPLSLAACGEVELNGKLFDAVGAQELIGGKKKNVKLQQRSKLILPPTTGTLPAPGSGVSNPHKSAYWPDDPDLRKKAEAEAHALAMKEKCRDLQWEERTKTDFVMPKECGSLLGKMLKGATQ